MSFFKDENFGGILPARKYGYNFKGAAQQIYELSRKRLSEERATKITRSFILKRYTQIMNKLLVDDMEHNDKIEIYCKIVNSYSEAIFTDTDEFEYIMKKNLAKKIKKYTDLITS